jgi:hypothetical protein
MNSKLDRALTGSAASVRDAGGIIDELAGLAAARLDSTAAYVRRHDPGIGLDHMRRIIRRHPARIVAGAAAAGFVFGMAALTVSALLRSSSAALEPSRT